MKVLIGGFILEANANIPKKTTLKDISIFTEDECKKKMKTVVEVLNENHIEVIPSVFADAGSNGIMEFDTFNQIKDIFLQHVEEHIQEIDGFYLHLHGASEVEKIGSGEVNLLYSLRKKIGPYMPIVVICDPHGNLSKEYVESINYIRSYRESPHIDIENTNRICAKQLCSILKNRRSMTPVYRKIPMILGGEQSVSTDEPVRSINEKLNELEQDYRIASCSWHVGYIRHDSPIAGCGIVVVPNDNKYREYAEKIADSLYDYIWEKRHEFHYTGRTMEPEEALKWAILQKQSPCFITDSGDNVTSGSMGVNTIVLKQLMKTDLLGKRVLLASIHDEKVFKYLSSFREKEIVEIMIGANFDENSSPVRCNVVVKGSYRQYPTKILGDFGKPGEAILVSLVGRNIDILVANTNQPYVERQQLTKNGLDWMDYDIVVIKCGYAFPEMQRDGICVMSLTQGATYQNTSKLPFKKIMRPMYPIDKI